MWILESSLSLDFTALAWFPLQCVALPFSAKPPSVGV